jgi:WD40 repeat protein
MKAVFICSLSMFLLAGIASAQEFGPWSQPVNLGAEINTASDDMHPTLSRDGLTMFFSSTRPGGAGGIDLWVTQRDSDDGAWQPPQNVAMLNTAADDHAPALSADEHWLFFFSTRSAAAMRVGARNYGPHTAKTNATRSPGSLR